MKKRGKRMTLRQRPVPTLRLRLKMVLLVTTSTSLIAFLLFLMIGSVGAPEQANASTDETIDSGSFIIRGGNSPQTLSNGVRRYGMVYDLVKVYNTPVKWIINDSKVKDGNDFVYNATGYAGGPFIIPAASITATVKARITYWLGRGVSGFYTTSAFTAPVYSTITVIPTITIDNTDGKQGIITDYFDNAEIPSSAYSVGATTALTSCHDLWINPHGDPTWASHSRLYNFAVTDGSFIFSQCHATSMMEGCKNPASPFQQLNFLSTTGLQCYNSGNCGSAITQTHGGSPTAPYTYYSPTDPIMQFVGNIETALSGGSEDWYIPQTTGGWRPTTRVLLQTADGPAGGKGVLLVYGPAYGLANAGWVMYESGHDFSGSDAASVGAQRAFFNFMLYAGTMKQLKISSVVTPSTFASLETKSLSLSVSSGTPGYTYQWTSTVAGTFSAATSASTTFKAPLVATITTGIFTCVVTDVCGRRNFITSPFTITPSALPVSLTEFTAEINKNNTVTLDWKTASEKDNDYFTIERTKDGKNFTELGRVDGAGNSNVMRKYSFTDDQPLVGTSYYRLKQTDYNGDSETFKLIQVNVTAKKTNSVQVYPNPFQRSFTAQFECAEEKEVQIGLYSSNGALVHSEKILANKGVNSYQFTAGESLNAGSFILKVADDISIIGVTNIIKNVKQWN